MELLNENGEIMLLFLHAHDPAYIWTMYVGKSKSRGNFQKKKKKSTLIVNIQRRN
jgi:hypothetical protein